MMYAALPTAGRFLVRRKRPNRPAVDNALRASWRPLKGDQFSQSLGVSPLWVGYVPLLDE